MSTDRLYGKPERSRADMTTNRQHIPQGNVSLSKSATDKDKVIGNVVLAPIMSRVLATALDMLLLIIAFLPLMLAVKDLGNIPTDLQDINAVIQYSATLSESIPQATQLTSNVMVFGLIALQLLFIILRGQSLGKLITGIRVVDQTTHRLPSFFRLVFIRTFLLALIYIPLFASPIMLILLVINYYMASKSAENIGLHDKLAKTLVVKADNSQLKKNDK